MSNKMLIDATHPEETRVVVLRGNRVEEFDFEAADRQQLRGNIYLAKVTRVEPSLQAAFVEYGGNRHGFLAFSEIHPDYYQIPVADRKALLEEHAAEVAEEVRREARQDAHLEQAESAPSDDFVETEQAVSEAGAESADSDDQVEPVAAEPGAEMAEPAKVELVGAEDALEEVPERRKPRPRQYKIQEVIKRRQVLLVQVVKEERGSKGAALTTFLSLAGRYSVLMPNTARGGGISRKITNAVDRKRLKSVASELEVPEGMGVILRTAGANRTKTEIKRDFEYLLRLWENVRELTLRSTAPTLVYEEGSLIKRSIRDLYSREIDQVVVAGDAAYREAKDFMRMLMPSHARNVQPYRNDVPIFARNGVEPQLDAMFSPQVTLPSGGYIVINQTEALVAIDVNSGRSTREHSIEDTALKTNLEAAEEVARQLRLRDLAGLIVIDFIDMEENRNNRAVERTLKDCLRADRARIQIGRISHFGLMEMSRQRMRTGVLESSTVSCPHCRGLGQVRSISSLSLQILRALEDHLLRHNGHHLIVRTRPDVALYILNQKRRHLGQLEARFALAITVIADTPHDGSGFILERGDPVLEPRPIREAVTQPTFEHAPVEDDEAQAIADEAAADAEAEIEAEPVGDGRRSRRDRPERAARGDRQDRSEERPEREPTGAAGEEQGREKRRRRRRRRGGAGEDRADPGRALQAGEAEPDDAEADASLEAGNAEGGDAEPREIAGSADEENGDARRRRRGRRGGRRRGRGRDDATGAEDAAEAGSSAEGSEFEFGPGDPGADEAGVGSDFPARTGEQDGPIQIPEMAGADSLSDPVDSLADRGGRGSEVEFAGEPDSPGAFPADTATSEMADSGSEAPAAPNGGSDTRASDTAPAATEAEAPEPDPAPAEVVNTGPKRTGWWNRRSLF